MQQTSLNQFLVAMAAVVVILSGIKAAAAIAVPFLLALFIAVICSPLIRAMTDRKIPLWLAVTILFCLIAVLSLFLAGLIGGTVNEFSASIPQYHVIFAQRLSEMQTLAQRLHIPFDLSANDVIEQIDPSAVMRLVSTSLLSVSGVVGNFFTLLLVIIFMLFESPTIKHKCGIAFGKHNEKQLDLVLQGIMGYLGVKTLTSLLAGGAVFLLLKLAGVQYAVLWATLTFLLHYIPNIGAPIASVPILFQAFLLNGFTTGFSVALAILVIHMTIGNVIEPRIMGRRLGLSTLVVFLSLLFWGWLLGTVGMLLSVPLTMTLKIALESSPNTVRFAVLLGEVAEEKLTK